ncbi:MAG: cob(I)yrinic acid a,c-diamide adenosyltransferase [Planctomycetes bacterium]|nr:cob(I)yrinic acid a,c-diamide adenosyltransferase [Planctomycetota bacterium]
MKIYTRTGDDGETGLLGGPRVAKDHERIAAYGDVDELNAAIGVARSESPHESMADQLETIQHELFALGAELASPDPQAMGTRWFDDARVARLELAIDAWEQRLPPLTRFILPGGTRIAAALHVARCVCRRAERQLVRLMKVDAAVGPLPLRYLNRLGDLLFVLARAANHEQGVLDHCWRKPDDPE